MLHTALLLKIHSLMGRQRLEDICHYKDHFDPICLYPVVNLYGCYLHWCFIFTFLLPWWYELDSSEGILKALREFCHERCLSPLGGDLIQDFLLFYTTYLTSTVYELGITKETKRTFKWITVYPSAFSCSFQWQKSQKLPLADLEVLRFNILKTVV